MKLDTLTSYGILPAFIECWKETIGEQLLDWQADALNHYRLLDGPAQRRNLLVVAPTSSGKTFIGELAAAAAALRSNGRPQIRDMRPFSWERIAERILFALENTIA